MIRHAAIVVLVVLIRLILYKVIDEAFYGNNFNEKYTAGTSGTMTKRVWMEHRHCICSKE